MPQHVVVYRRPGCMFCEQVEELLQEAGVPYRSEEIADREAQDRICRQHGALSFPVVLADQTYVGSFTHIVQLHAQGRLATIAGLDPEKPEQTEETGRAPRPGSLEGYAQLGRLMKNRGDR